MALFRYPGLLPQGAILPELELRLLFYLYKTVVGGRGRKVKYFFIPISLQRGCVHFCLPAVTHRRVCSGGFL